MHFHIFIIESAGVVNIGITTALIFSVLISSPLSISTLASHSSSYLWKERHKPTFLSNEKELVNSWQINKRSVCSFSWGILTTLFLSKYESKKHLKHILADSDHVHSFTAIVHAQFTGHYLEEVLDMVVCTEFVILLLHQPWKESLGIWDVFMLMNLTLFL